MSTRKTQVNSCGYWSFLIQPYELVAVTPGAQFRITHACFGRGKVDRNSRQKIFMKYPVAGSSPCHVCVGTLVPLRVENVEVDYILEPGTEYIFDTAASQAIQIHGCFSREHVRKPKLTQIKISTRDVKEPKAAAGKARGSKTPATKAGKSAGKARKHDDSTDVERTEGDPESEDGDGDEDYKEK